MTAMTIQEVSRRSGLSEPTLRYYEEVGLVGPVGRDTRSGHRRYQDADLDVLQALACLRALGMGIEDMRTYQANRARRGTAVAAEQRDLLLRHATSMTAEIAALHTRLDYLREKAALWDARAHGEAQPARAQVRSAAKEDGLRAAVRRGVPGTAGPDGTADARLQVVTADLMSDDGWKAAMADVDEVYHVASPIPAAQPDNPDELIVPAREGTVRVLRAARDAGARRVVLTSSFAAIGYTPKPGGEFTEDDWTDPDMPGLAPYPRSKTIAERAAWDFMNAEGGSTELVVINPTFILGPPLTSETGSSMQLIKAMFNGQMSVAPRHRFGIADVRDVADVHIRAMAAPAAAGRRFIAVSDHPPMTYLEFAGILRERFGELAAKAPTEQAPGGELPPMVIRNDRAKDELGWRPRPVEETIADTVEALRERGALAG